MVTRIQRNDTAMYLCEFCGFGYRTIENAERCEQHCGIDGFTSPEIRRKAVFEPRIHVVPLAPNHNDSLTSSSSKAKTLQSFAFP
jgi:hypothetical protein